MTEPLSPIDAVRRAFCSLPRALVAPDGHVPLSLGAIRPLSDAGLLTAILPTEEGGSDLWRADRHAELRDLLIAVGRASLVLGRIYEGHVNAHLLVLRYGSERARRRMAADARAGHLSGVWNTEPANNGLKLVPDGDGFLLSGSKSLASGVGLVSRPLVTGQLVDGSRLMLIPDLALGERADLSEWRAHGMRGSATGTCDLDGIRVGPDAVIGEPNDYGRQPMFSGSAWRFLAVQTGGIEAVFELHRQHMRMTGRGADPQQLARLGLAATAVETARLFVARAGQIFAAPDTAESVVAAVNVARGAVERAGLDVLEFAHRSVGLQGFLEVHPLEQASRDLATYLRQPGPDHALAQAATYILSQDEPLEARWPLP